MRVALVIFLFSASYCEATSDYRQYGNTDAGGGGLRVVVDVARYAKVHANTTCGISGDEEYCILQDVSFVQPENCQMCLSPPSFPASPSSSSTRTTSRETHPASAITDDNPDTWWQSPTLQQSLNNQFVSITFDLKQDYEVLRVTLRSGISPLPAVWILERSTNGGTYTPWQYFVNDDALCRKYFQLSPVSGIPKLSTDDEVICTSYYASIMPLQKAEVRAPLQAYRPSAHHPSSVLIQFLRARFVRLRFLAMYTIGQHTDMFESGTPSDDFLKNYFYTLSGVEIEAKCFCNGHADGCSIHANGTNVCRCQNNTCGSSCDQCCPLYRAKPWKPGGSDGGVCTRCQCNGHAASCLPDTEPYSNTGVCVNCQNNTAGKQCELCETGFYRPLNANLTDSCIPCTCRGAGSTSDCIQNSGTGLSFRVPGECVCREGYTGPECDRCISGYTGYPDCFPCHCDPAGMKDNTSGPYDCPQSPLCDCKRSVTGDRCDQCEPGHFNLKFEHEDGCKPCYCSGLTTDCTTTTLYVKNITTAALWKVTSLDGSTIADPSYIDGATRTIIKDSMYPLSEYYWQAPNDVLGSLLYSYGQRMQIYTKWIIGRGDTTDRRDAQPDFIIEGDGIRVGFGSKIYMSTSALITATFDETLWYIIPKNASTTTDEIDQWQSRIPSRDEFMRVLLNVKRLLVRATYHSEQIESSLIDWRLESAVETGAGPFPARTQAIERCNCPMGYSGPLCDRCAWGYGRSGQSCVLCPCQGHASTCNPDSQHCGKCEHNTTGDSCQHCAPGFYGNALLGTSSACQPCECGLSLVDLTNAPTNHISELCSSINGGSDYVCHKCPEERTGSHCEKCAPGYYGDATSRQGCRPCRCHSNNNLNGTAICDSTTGKCLECHDNTAGWSCQICSDGFYGNATRAPCQDCDCREDGSITPVCDHVTGQCRCRERYTGVKCDQCQNARGNVEAECLPCFCDVTGSVSHLCDLVTGQCTCKPGVTGVNCESCQADHYGFAGGEGCQGCNCDPVGSLTSSCDIISGQCSCQANVTGRTCDRCQVGHYDFHSGQGCRSCSCSPEGTEAGECDQVTGQCLCLPGAGGRHCDLCLSGYYRSTSGRCLECEPCELPGHICEPLSGRCVCPPHTEGNHCQRCQAGFWNWQPNEGCQQCECDERNSVSMQCDVLTGQCSCFDGFNGLRCDRCDEGFHSYPDCVPCSCNRAGSMNCSGDQCLCRQTDGACTCKVNVVGKRCDRCAANSFGLSEDVAGGCTRCFCFDRSSKCSQSQMIWKQLTLGSGRSVTRSEGRSQLQVFTSLRVIPEHSGDLRLGLDSPLTQPVYWQLPDQFLGNKILSYGGFVRFRLEESAGSVKFPAEVLQSHPLVQLQSNTRLVLQHRVGITETTRRSHSVRLHESSWSLKDSPGVQVTREIIMVALQQVQHVLIRATSFADSKEFSISAVSWDIAQPSTQPTDSKTAAFTVETCQCSAKYNGTSCQDPGAGYYRKFRSGYLNSDNVIDLIGESVPCQCHDRSSVCHPETGHCLSCSGNTAGPNCDRCSDGYYGNSYYDNDYHGNVNTTQLLCHRCLCPTSLLSHAESCVASLDGYFRCQCHEGYSGQRCDRCAFGYYGNALDVNIGCTPCACDEAGSRNVGCDPVTGQCQCQPGLTGRTCSHCEHRHVPVGSRCQDCHDPCFDRLFEDLDILHQSTSAINLSNFTATAPWKKLRMTNDTMFNLRDRLESYQLNLASLIALKKSSDLSPFANTLGIMLEELIRSLPEKVNEARSLRNKLDEIFQTIKSAEFDSEDTVGRLRRYIDSAASSVTIERALDESRAILSQLETRDFTAVRQRAHEDLSRSLRLLNRLKSLSPNTTQLQESQEKLDATMKRLHDVAVIIQQLVQQPLSQVEDTLAVLSRKLLEIGSAVNETGRLHESTKTLLSNGSQLIEKGQELQQKTQSAFNEIRDRQTRLQVLNGSIADRTTTLNQMEDTYHVRYVVPAQVHAATLQRTSRSLQSLFSATREGADLSLRAADAFGDIHEAIRHASQAAKSAEDASHQAFTKLHPADSDSLSDVANAVKIKSELQFENAEILREKVEEQMEKLKLIGESLASANITMRTAAQINTDLTNSLKKIDPTAGGGEILRARALTQHAMASLSGVRSRAGHLNDRVNKQLLAEHNRLGSQWRSLIDNTTSTIDTVRDNLRKVDLHSINAEQRMDGLTKISRTFNDKLSQLRNKVLKARQSVSNMRASLSASGAAPVQNRLTCRRSFLVPQLHPSPASNLRLVYTSSDQNNMNALLFVAVSGNQKDFMSIEMVNRSIRFSWDNGGGSQYIDHPLKLRSLPDVWYIIEAERIGNIGRLTVSPSIDTATSISVTDSSPPGFNVLDLTSSDPVFVGRPAVETLGSNLPITGQSFSGCLSELNFNGNDIGLWNFQTNEGRCSVCSSYSRDSSTEELEGVSFNGDGYSELASLQAALLFHRDLYSLTLRLKTFDEYGLIFFTANSDTGQYISLHLSDGLLVAQVGFTWQHVVSLTSAKKYNNNKWTSVELTKYKNRVVLRMNGEEFHEDVFEPSSNFYNESLSTAEPKYDGKQFELQLESSMLYFGGVPPDFERSPWTRVTFSPLFGCLSDIQVAMLVQDLMSGNMTGIQRGCGTQNINKVEFGGAGYLETDSHRLKRKFHFGFSFRTNSPNGLLLLSSFAGKVSADSPKNKEYYMVSMTGGRLALTMNGGHGELQILSDGRYSDDSVHNIQVVKDRRRVELRIDDIAVGVAKLPRGSSIVDSPDRGGLYFGGVPSDVSSVLAAPVPVPFTGCLFDVIFNNKLMTFGTPLRHGHVQLGRCHGDRGTRVRSEGAPSSPLQHGRMLSEMAVPYLAGQSCSGETPFNIEQGAVKFGDEKISFASIKIRSRLMRYDFNVSIRFRTTHPDGVLLYTQTGRGFFSAALRHGSVEISVGGGGKNLRFLAGHKLHDGKWKNMSLVKTKRKYTLLIDEFAPVSRRGPRFTRSGRRLFLASPPTRTKRTVPRESQRWLIGNPKQRGVQQFKGCLSQLYINGELVDLAVSPGVNVKGIRQYMTNVEAATFFTGDGFISYDENIRFGDVFEVELQFKTAKLNGIIISASSSPSGNTAISLELVDGQVVFSVFNGGDVPTRAVHKFPSKFHACDNRWHTVRANFVKYQMTLQVDSASYRYGFVKKSRNLNRLSEIVTLYLGGAPREAVVNPALTQKSNWSGCLRNVRIDGLRADVSQMDRSPGVLLDSCPLDN